MTWTKLKIAAVITIGVLLASGTILTTAKVLEPPDYSWRVPQPNEKTFTNARPQLTILPTKFGSNYSWRVVVAPDGKCMGIKMTPEEMIQAAHQAAPWLNGIQTIVDAQIPTNEYDFICNLTQGASNELQKAIAKKFGITVRHQMIETNVLVLSVRNPDAPGLKRDNKQGRKSWRPDHFSMHGLPLLNLVGSLHQYFGLPVIDQTGLSGNFSLDLTWKVPAQGQPPSLEPLNQALISQTGLELTPKVQPVLGGLVIEKTR